MTRCIQCNSTGWIDDKFIFPIRCECNPEPVTTAPAAELDVLRCVVRDLVAWAKRYPSSRIYGHTQIVEIAREIDAIAKAGEQALASTAKAGT